MRNQLLGDRYRIKGLIGEGGMASVYVAIDEKLGRRVAIKVLHSHLTQHSEIRQRFHQEARAVSQLDHPNIIKVFDFSGENSEKLWIVSEVLKGKNLAQYVQKFKNSALHPIVATLMVREICRALEYAHNKGIVHRDIKPENIMVLTDGRIKLMDFGISKNLKRSNVTMTGTMMGSPSYMSPEQIRGRDMDHRTDIYSLSVLYYEIICGILPFVAQTTPDVISKIMTGRYLAPGKILPDLPRTINNIIVKGMSLKAEERFRTSESMAEALDSVLKDYGFIESHVELERFFKNPDVFESRLREISLQVKNESSKRLPSKPASRNHHANTRMLEHTYQSEVTALRAALSNEQTQKVTIHHRHPTQIQTRMVAKKSPRPPITSAVSIPPRAVDYRRPKIPTAGGQHHQPQRMARPNIKMRRTDRQFEMQSVIFPPENSGSQRSRFFGIALVGIILAVIAVSYFGLTKISRDFMTEQNFTTSLDIPKPKKNRKAPRKPKIEKVAEIAPEPLPTTNPIATEMAPPKLVNKPTLSPKLEKSTVVSKPSRTAQINKPDAKTTAKPPVRENSAPAKTEKNLFSREKTPINTAATGSQQPVKSTPDTKAPVKANAEGKKTSETPEKIPPKEVGKTSPRELSKPSPVESAAEMPVFIVAEPASQIAIDGRAIGTTNDLEIRRKGIKLTPGSHSLELRRTGYENMTQTIQVVAGQKNRFSYTLKKEERPVRFTLRTSHFPATAHIEDIKGGPAMDVPMTSTVSSINLAPGNYRIQVTYANRTIERTVTLTSNSGALTFNADFSKGE